MEFSKEDREEKKASSGGGVSSCFSEVSTRISATFFPTIKWLVVQFNQNGDYSDYNLLILVIVDDYGDYR